MIRGCVVLDGYLNIFEMVDCDQEKERADGLSGQNAGGREDYPAGMQVAEVNPRPFWGVEIYYVQVANSFDPLEM